MAPIDEEGYLFGLVNVVDALAVLLLVAVVVAGSAFVLQSGVQAQEQASHTTVVVQTAVAPYVVDALSEGRTPADDVRAVENVAVGDRLELNGTDRYGSEAYYRVSLRVELATETGDDGLVRFRGERLYVGRELQLDLGSTIVDVVVVEVSEGTAAG